MIAATLRVPRRSGASRPSGRKNCAWTRLFSGYGVSTGLVKRSMRSAGSSEKSRGVSYAKNSSLDASTARFNACRYSASLYPSPDTLCAVGHLCVQSRPQSNGRTTRLVAREHSLFSQSSIQRAYKPSISPALFPFAQFAEVFFHRGRVTSRNLVAGAAAHLLAVLLFHFFANLRFERFQIRQDHVIQPVLQFRRTDIAYLQP